MRVKFKRVGEQKKFLDLVVQNSNSPSLRSLLQFGLKVNYQTLKSYYNENRTLPEDIFDVFCEIGKVEKKKVRVILLNDNWGRVKGGKNSRKGKKVFYRR